ncbi:pentapeptide repeat-containing protein [Aquibium sp. ELW1220]|uniref:pentapeptide repeat-containing protein n=1 Tax=Aquibium sp. ELW1220 TaxID=2976766 RepID=UPI0025B2676A|nr:pentapeptide repeat-containing protein [Aquibium sp. ELW1220]MDN2579919.1 pentapeptide repeat-containing protein [Aquibium sp. ELW1220]
MTMAAAGPPGGSEPISITLTLPFSLYGWGFFAAIVLAVALVGAATWCAHLWATRKTWTKSLGERLPRLHERRALNWLAWLAVVLTPFWLLLIALTIDGTFTLWFRPPLAGNASDSQAALAYRIHYLALVGLMTALAGLVAAPLALIRVFTTERQTVAAEQGLITDRINKAVEGLGAEKTVKRVIETPRYRKGADGGWLRDAVGRLVVEKGPDGADLVDRETVERTVPNLEVRIGSIYALERIAQDSLRDHIQIMEILCAYIRENAPASRAINLPDVPRSSTLERLYNDNLHQWRERCRSILATAGEDGGPIRPRQDIQVALTVIGRRGERQRGIEHSSENHIVKQYLDQLDNVNYNIVGGEIYSNSYDIHRRWRDEQFGYRLDLSRVNLQGANLRRGNFDKINLSESRMEGVMAHGASFCFSLLQKSRFDFSNLSNATIRNAIAADANFNSTYGENTDFSNSSFNRASLFDFQAYFCNFKSADFRKSNLSSSNFDGSDLTMSDLCSASLSKSTSFINANVRLICVKETELYCNQITLENLDLIFGDASVLINFKSGAERLPTHWSTEIVPTGEFYELWKKWIGEMIYGN